MSKDEGYYRVMLPGVPNLPKIPLTKEELRSLEKTLPLEVSYNYKNGIHTKKAQEAAMELFSITYYRMGGRTPCYSTVRGKTNKSRITPSEEPEYMLEYIDHACRRVKAYNPDKGPWGFYCKYIMLKARESYFKKSIKCRANKALEDEWVKEEMNYLDDIRVLCKYEEDLKYLSEGNDETYE